MKLSEWWEPGSPMYLHYRAKETTCNACWEPVSDANPLEPKKDSYDMRCVDREACRVRRRERNPKGGEYDG